MTVAEVRLCIVLWVDSSLQNGQVDSEDFPRPANIATAGWLVERTPEHLVIARDDMGHDGDFRGLCAIPSCCVTNIHFLDDGKAVADELSDQHRRLVSASDGLFMLRERAEHAEFQVARLRHAWDLVESATEIFAALDDGDLSAAEACNAWRVARGDLTSKTAV